MIACGSCGAPNFISRDLQPGATTPCGRCGAEIMVPFSLRHFEVRQPIAAGGMGMVFRAFDTILHRDVAVKLLRQELAHDRRKVDDFYHEARVCAALNHPHIVQIFHFGEFEAQNFIAMELADAGSLESRILAQKRLGELAVLDVGIKIAGALDAALQQGFLHRDIKPSNILFNAAGEPKLVDFGLARRVDAEAEFSSVIWGTPDYAPPERIRRVTETFHSDMYALGATLYHAITGRAPFARPSTEATLQAHLNEPVEPPVQLAPEISPAANDALVRTLAKEPGRRFPSYDELVMALTAARSELLVTNLKGNKSLASQTRAARPLTSAFRRTPTVRSAAPRPPEPEHPAPPPCKPGSRSRWLAAAVAAFAVALAVVGWKIPWLRPKAREFSAPAEVRVPDPSTPATAQPPPPRPAPSPTAKAASKAKAGGSGWVLLSATNAPRHWRALGATNFPASVWHQEGSNLVPVNWTRTVIVTRQRFRDFELQFDWKAEPNTTAAVLFAVREPRGRQPLGAFKIPLGDDAKTVDPKQSAGALAGWIAPAAEKRLQPPGEFNATRLIVLSNQVALVLNGRRVLDFGLDAIELAAAPARERPALKPDGELTTDGLLGLQPGPGIVFRNVRVRRITQWPAMPKPAPAKARPVRSVKAQPAKRQGLEPD
jgi:serine/threonine protein kinase